MDSGHRKWQVGAATLYQWACTVLVIVCLVKWLGAKPANPPEITPEPAGVKTQIRSRATLAKAKAVMRVYGEQVYQFQNRGANRGAVDKDSSLPERLPGLPWPQEPDPDTAFQEAKTGRGSAVTYGRLSPDQVYVLPSKPEQ